MVVLTASSTAVLHIYIDIVILFPRAKLALSPLQHACPPPTTSRCAALNQLFSQYTPFHRKRQQANKQTKKKD
jgi:hypothetical protein